MATLIAPSNHSPVEDAESLRKAVKGWGADGKAIIAILGHRNATQRTLIREAYQNLFQEDLIKRLESELSGDFERAMYRWILEPAEREALLANIAIKSADKNYQVIVEISCVLSPEELFALLVGLVSSFRYGGSEINAKLAQSEADALHEAIKNKNKSNDEIIRILTTRSKTQLVATFNRYRDDHGIAITKKLSDEGSDEFHKAANLAISCINDHKKYYEKVLRNAMEHLGTAEDALTRVIVTRAEKDLKEIKEVYYKRNSVHLEHAVAKETSGDYKKFLLSLMGKEE
ncbi:Annexin-like protein RJ4 [Glycine soja]